MLDYMGMWGRRDNANALRPGKRKNGFIISVREEGIKVSKLKHSAKNLKCEGHWYAERR